MADKGGSSGAGKTRRFAARLGAWSAKTVGPPAPGRVLPFSVAASGNVGEETGHPSGVPSNGRPRPLPPESGSSPPAPRPGAESLANQRVDGRDVGGRAPSKNTPKNGRGRAGCASERCRRARRDTHGGMVSPSPGDGVPGVPPRTEVPLERHLLRPAQSSQDWPVLAALDRARAHGSRRFEPKRASRCPAGGEHEDTCVVQPVSLSTYSCTRAMFDTKRKHQICKCREQVQCPAQAA